MRDELISRMEAYIVRLEGNVTHVKRVLLLSKLIQTTTGKL